MVEVPLLTRYAPLTARILGHDAPRAFAEAPRNARERHEADRVLEHLRAFEPPDDAPRCVVDVARLEAERLALALEPPADEASPDDAAWELTDDHRPRLHPGVRALALAYDPMPLLDGRMKRAPRGAAGILLQSDSVGRVRADPIPSWLARVANLADGSRPLRKFVFESLQLARRVPGDRVLDELRNMRRRGLLLG